MGKQEREDEEEYRHRNSAQAPESFVQGSDGAREENCQGEKGQRFFSSR